MATLEQREHSVQIPHSISHCGHVDQVKPSNNFYCCSANLFYVFWNFPGWEIAIICPQRRSPARWSPKAPGCWTDIGRCAKTTSRWDQLQMSKSHQKSDAAGLREPDKVMHYLPTEFPKDFLRPGGLVHPVHQQWPGDWGTRPGGTGTTRTMRRGEPASCRNTKDMQESERVKRTKCLSNWPSRHASLVPTGPDLSWAPLFSRGSTTLPIPESRVEEEIWCGADHGEGGEDEAAAGVGEKQIRMNHRLQPNTEVVIKTLSRRSLHRGAINTQGSS